MPPPRLKYGISQAQFSDFPLSKFLYKEQYLGNSYIPITVALIALFGVVYKIRKDKEKIIFTNKLPILKDAKIRFETMKGHLIQSLPDTTCRYISDSKNWFIENEHFLSKNIMDFWKKIQKENISWAYNTGKLKQEQGEKKHEEIATLVTNSVFKIQDLIEKAINEIAKEFK